MQTPFSDFYNYVKHFLEIVNVCRDYFIQQSSNSHKKLRAGGGGGEEEEKGSLFPLVDVFVYLF